MMVIRLVSEATMPHRLVHTLLVFVIAITFVALGPAAAFAQTFDAVTASSLQAQDPDNDEEAQPLRLSLQGGFGFCCQNVGFLVGGGVGSTLFEANRNIIVLGDINLFRMFERNLTYGTGGVGYLLRDPDGWQPLIAAGFGTLAGSGGGALNGLNLTFGIESPRARGGFGQVRLLLLEGQQITMLVGGMRF